MASTCYRSEPSHRGKPHRRRPDDANSTTLSTRSLCVSPTLFDPAARIELVATAVPPPSELIPEVAGAAATSGIG